MQNATSATRWWQEPTMWLVLGGPTVVVLASFATLAIALNRPDPVLPTDVMGTPAVQARNHAAAPVAAPRKATP